MSLPWSKRGQRARKRCCASVTMPPTCTSSAPPIARLRGPEAAAWLARLEPEQDNLRAALQWALDERRYTDTAWLLLAADGFWFHIGHWYESARWLAQLLPHREALAADLRLAFLINLLAPLRAHRKNSSRSRRYTDELMGLLEVCSDKLLHSAAWLGSRTIPLDLAEAASWSERSRAPAPPVKRRGWAPNSAL